MSSTGLGPARPYNIRDVVEAISGMPVFLGAITSVAAAAVNNATTAVPFNYNRRSLQDFTGTLAGKVLLCQTTNGGYILPGYDPAVLTITDQATPPVIPTSLPGVYIGNAERVEIMVGQQTGWLQFVGIGASSTLFVWEML